ncbi:class I SAM-dependent methyltransferase [Sanguibacter antarcticus]|uniref:2-polyprenyl-3-methyl-5-hydroxy-6-metoxy-1, 4-benzoquinol methylase n=1 Tax=Sanguibacter antarcticus TaxID=372484 RepID=A0A2A9E2Y5_9MICO|nr:class I SAM-dependent methyltransferase [Sanguibacter antarcticus]PFG33193.1 2-polyprenyl-3-methyl-5-hydroxy-6-metoxy-1,4-benzoquinol methylase [Sanguibacter antarcticus]
MSRTTATALPRPPLAPDLTDREVHAHELMDDPGCDLDTLRRTYALFRPVNRVVAGWRHVYVRQLRPLLSRTRPTTMLDVGSGGGDVPRAIARWAAQDRLRLDITAVDPDERAHAYASALPPLRGLTFRRALSTDLVAAGDRFDLVTSNHVLHHLDGAGLTTLLADSEALARRLVVHNDIARGTLAYGAFRAATIPLGRRSFIHHDGALSVRRSYQAAELRSAVLAAGADTRWRVTTTVPFRVILHWSPGRDGTPRA